MNVDISADTRCVTDGCSAPGMWPASNSAGERTSMVSTRGLHLKASKFPIFGRFRRFLCLLAYCCAFYTKNRRYPLMWIPSLWPSPPQLRQVRTTFRAATYPGCDSNDTGEGPRGLVELDHPRLPERSQRYNAELTELIMTFSDASKAFKTLPLNAQASMLKDLTPVRGEVEKVSQKCIFLRAFFVPTATVSFGRWWKRWKLSHLKMTPPSDFIQWNS